MRHQEDHSALGVSRLVRSAALCAVLLAAAASGQQTGSVFGVVRDRTGGVLPDVVVSIHSGNTVGVREQRTGAGGGYSLQNLEVGSYWLTFARLGFRSASADVVIEAGGHVQLDVTLEVGAVREAAEISVEAPLVDPKSTGLEQTVDQDLLQGAPNGRSLWVVLGQTSGVVLDQFDVGGSEAGQQAIFSATGTAYNQNQYSLNGVNATDPAALGASATYYSYDSFEEVQVSTSGHDAEIQSPGVFINVILKSGSNRFHGGGAFYWEDDALQSDNLDGRLRAQGIGQSNRLQRYFDYSLELGGPIASDRAFFYANVSQQQIEPFVIGFFLPTGEPGVDATTLRNLFVRGTLQLSTSQSADISFFRGDKLRSFRDAGRFRPTPVTALYQDSSTDIFQLAYKHIISENSLLDARFSGLDLYFPLGQQPELPPDAYSRIELSSAIRSVGPGSHRLYQRTRWQGNASLYWFRDELLGGSHDFKFGWQQSYSPTSTTEDLNGAILYRDFFGAPFQVELYNDPVAVKNFTKNIGFFAQDSFVRGRLTMNVGVRFDRWSVGYPEQSSEPGRWGAFFTARGLPSTTPAQSDLVVWNSLAPRLGASYSITSSGRALLKGGYSRYYHQIGISLADFANPNSRASALFFFDDRNRNRLLDPGEVRFDAPLSVSLPAQNTIAPDVAQTFTDEVTLGVEHQLSSDLALGAHAIYRRDANITDDINIGVPPTEYTEGLALDPGRDLVVGTADDSVVPIFNQSPESLGQDRFLFTNPEGLRGSYRGIMLEARKRYAGGWQLLASLTLAESQGFLPGPGLETTEGSGAPSPLFDNPNRQTNAYGRTYWDRPRIFRASGSYDFRWGLVFGGAVRLQTGQPLYRSVQVAETLEGVPLNQGPVEVLAEPQGWLVQPTVAIIDIRAEKEFRFGSKGRLGLTFDVFNLLNANTAVDVSSRSRSFGATLSILPPRIARIGVKYSF